MRNGGLRGLQSAQKSFLTVNVKEVVLPNEIDFSQSRIINGEKTIGSMICLNKKQVALLIENGIKTVPDLAKTTQGRLLEIGLSKSCIQVLSDTLKIKGRVLQP